MMKNGRKTTRQKSLVPEWVVEVETPTIRKLIEKGATMLLYYYEINILSIFSLKESDLLVIEL